MRSSLERFSDRVENYIKYRPSYPPQVVETLQAECGLSVHSTVADIGCGPGNLAALILPVGAKVYGVEPNLEMREAGEKLLADEPGFKAVDGSAEKTTLADRSIDLITAGQAFHWFDFPVARAEFRRILKPDGWVALVWNTRLTDETPFARAYEKLLKDQSEEYSKVDHRNVGREIISEFFTGSFQRRIFPYVQMFDWDGLKGRALSSSYVSLVEPQLSGFLGSLKEIFDENANSGQVAFEYQTELFFGQIAS
jgi:SAM-dependent methyltransferase